MYTINAKCDMFEIWHLNMRSENQAILSTKVQNEG